MYASVLKFGKSPVAIIIIIIISVVKRGEGYLFQLRGTWARPGSSFIWECWRNLPLSIFHWVVRERDSVTSLSSGPPSDICLEVSVESLSIASLFHFEFTAKSIKLTLSHVTLLKSFNTVWCTVNDNFCMTIDQWLKSSFIASTSLHVAAVMTMRAILCLSKHDNLLSR